MARTYLLLTAVTAALMAATGVALPQSATPPAAAPARPNVPCAPGAGSQPPASGDSKELSDKLARSGGVICPPQSRDTEMAVPPPSNSSRTPVIPPPGTPGGDQNIQPK